MIVCVLGVDPGVTTGICRLRLETASTGRLAITERLVLSCNAAAAGGLAEHLIKLSDGSPKIVIGGERFVPGNGAGAKGPQAAVTRQVISAIDSLFQPVAWRSAAEVKTWAAEERMKKSGLYDMTRKMIDAYDASRHALFAAVHDCGLPDPLSRKR